MDLSGIDDNPGQQTVNPHFSLEQSRDKAGAYSGQHGGGDGQQRVAGDGHHGPYTRLGLAIRATGNNPDMVPPTAAPKVKQPSVDRSQTLSME